MSTPRDGGPDGAEERPEDQRGWTEPTHPGGPGSGDAPGSSSDGGATEQAWEPPGWSLPSAEPDRPTPAPPEKWQPPQTSQQQPDQQQDWDATPPAPQGPQPWDAPRQAEPWDTPQQQEPPRRGGLLGGLFGGGRQRQGPQDERRGWGEREQLGEALVPDVDPTDRYGTRSWGAAMGWTATDGSGPEDAAITALVQSAPIRAGKQDGPGNVLRGRADGLDLVVFDVVSPVGRGWAVTHAVTAAPLLGHVPDFRLTPARFWRHGTGGLLQIPSGDPEFDQRYVLLSSEDGPQVRRLVDDPVVRQALLGSDDGDEVWSAVGFVAAVRPDAHRPQLIQHHARLLAAVSAALAAGSPS